MVPLSVDHKSFVFLQIIQNLIQLSPLKFNFFHVSGHQTDHFYYNDLDWWGEMNDKMDKMAKTFITICTTMASIFIH